MIYETIAARKARLKKLGADDPRTRKTAGQTSGRAAGTGSATFGTAGGGARVIESTSIGRVYETIAAKRARLKVGASSVTRPGPNTASPTGDNLKF